MANSLTSSMSFEPFNKLVKLAARAFYDDVSTIGERNQAGKAGKSDNRGVAVVVLDALTRRQWVREEDLAKDLKLHSKQLRRTLKFFEEEKLVNRHHRKETAKGAKMYSLAVATTADGKQTGKEGEEKIRLHTHSYCCLDYAQIYDVVRYRLHRMRKKLKDELESRNTVQTYVCPSCQRRYTAFDALQLISPGDESFRCESCRAELIVESDRFAAEDDDSDDKARKQRRRRENLKDMLKKMEDQLKPLTDQLARLKDLNPPELGSLPAWERRANAAALAANGDSSTNDSSRSSQFQGFGGTQISYLVETKVEVALSGVPEMEEELKHNSDQGKKVLPPWMIKQSMKLTSEQLGESKQELQMDNSVPGGSSDKVDEKDEKNIKDEYVKAYYAALVQQQQKKLADQGEQELEDNINASASLYEIMSNRQVGIKSKHEEYESDDDAKQEEHPVSGGAGKMYDLNVEAVASDDKDDDDDDEDIWEEVMNC